MSAHELALQKALIAHLQAAVRALLGEPEAGGVRTVSLRVTFADVFPGAKGARTFAVLRVRAVTEEIET